MTRSSQVFTKFFMSLICITLTAGCMHTKTQSSFSPDMATASKTYAPIPSTLSGSYLAGRFAQQQQDWDNAFHYMSQALALSDTSEHNTLLDRTFLLALGNAEIKNAELLANKIIERNSQADIAFIFKSSLAFKNLDYKGAKETLDKIDQKQFGSYTIPLLQAWIKAAEGETGSAVDILNTSEYKQDSVYVLHKALMYDIADDPKAETLYEDALRQGMTLHETLIAANYFERHNKTDLAQSIYDAIYNQDPHSPFVAEGFKRIKTGVMPPKTIAEADDGLVFALFSMASLLYERQAYDSALIYCRIIENLQPEKGFINLMIGDILALTGNYSGSIEHYRRVEKEDILFKMAQLRTVEVLDRANRTSEALDMLSVIAEQDGMRLEALTYIGDIYQRQNRFDLALEAYDRAITTLGDRVSPQHWSLIYARGMSYERLNNWSSAEKDLLHALEYQPENPHILNYLGYSWVEKGVNLDRAMDMIRKAVVLKPNDGFIIDSYGWAFYKKGKFEDAVYWLERAVELVPDDANLNDHLGDAYWQMDREKEARFQWKRAYKLSSDQNQKNQIGQKLKNGLKKQPMQNVAAKREAALY